MFVPYPVQRRWIGRWASFSLLLIVVALGTSGCGGDAQVRQQALENLHQLQQQILHAQQIGIPTSYLEPIISQEQQLAHSSAPLSLLSNQPINSYNAQLAQHYTQLQGQLQTIVLSGSRQLQSQAQQDLLQAQAGLKLWSDHSQLLQGFHPQFLQLQSRLKQAKQPKDFVVVNMRAQPILNVLGQLQATSTNLTSLNTMISLMQDTNLDTTDLQSSDHTDQNMFQQAQTMPQLNALSNTIIDQYQQAETTIEQAIPMITTTKLTALQQQIQQMPQYQIDTTPYQRRYNADQQLVQKNMSFEGYQFFAKQIDTDLAQAQTTVLKAEGKTLLAQYNQEALTWGNDNAYYDSYDNKSYDLDVGYLNQGIGSILASDLAQAQSIADLQYAVQEIQTSTFNLHMLELDASDATAYNQVHQTDLEILNHYKLQHSQVIMVSLANQAMRIYQNGQLIKSFLVTTGREDLPSLPGVWSVEDKEAPTEFRSTDPPGSPDWYPPTHINYAILFHSGGYFIHDAWWRDYFGPGTQFPHYDPANDPIYADSGSHGCINMPTDEAGWVYNNTGWNSTIVIY